MERTRSGYWAARPVGRRSRPASRLAVWPRLGRSGPDRLTGRLCARRTDRRRRVGRGDDHGDRRAAPGGRGQHRRALRRTGTLVTACLAAGSGYLDLANDVAAVLGLLGRDPAARDAGCTLVTGAGFGVTATESVVVALVCRDVDRPTVRVDMVPSPALEAVRWGRRWRRP